jgi:hypothetical protein
MLQEALKLSPVKIIEKINKHQQALKKAKQSETFNDSNKITKDDAAAGVFIAGGIFIYILLIILWFSLFVFAIAELIKNWKNLPVWARVVCVLFMLPYFPVGGPILTLIVIFVAKNGSKHNNKDDDDDNKDDDSSKSSFY